MSWAANNVEKYDEIIRAGVLHWIDNLIDKAGFAVPGEWLTAYEVLIELIQADPLMRSLYEDLLHLASRDITHAEQDYFVGLADQIKERYDGK